MPIKTYLSSAQFNARIMGLDLLEVIHKVVAEINCSSPHREAVALNPEPER